MKKVLFIWTFFVLTSFVQAQIINARPPYVAPVSTVWGNTVIDTLGYFGNPANNVVPTDLRASKTTSTATGYIDTLYVYMSTEASGDSVKLAIYSDNADYPGSLLGQTNIVQSNQGASADIAVPLQARVYVTNTVVYWMSARMKTSSIFYVTSGNIYALAHTWGTSLPNPFTAGATSGTATYRIWGKIKE